MRFKIQREELRRVHMYEMKGEFIEASSLQISAEKDTMRFGRVYLTGEEKPAPEALVLEVSEGEMRPYAVITGHSAFFGRPRYAVKPPKDDPKAAGSSKR
ncbi:uncharacterized protein NEMAJ01_0266 [Nematocida major]|uniref:uncharacterized protein n=1 Tax=Nematocida major TaxID=1912982 RepID=UPI002007CB3A|nr:uncharacterized protein NEMAJ01_0266 [Nematocida major]KAH9385370.1 hypothetical protein NEMAJ01_0266 [Nematocida major]